MPDSPQISLPDDPRVDGSAMEFWNSARVSARTALIIAAVAACLIFGNGAKIFSLPILPGFDGSLLAQPQPLAVLLIIAVMLVLSAVVGTIIARTVHFEAGLFSAAFGLMVLSLRCGTIQSVLFESGGTQIVYLRLVLELLILSAFLVGIWFLLCRFDRSVKTLPEDSNILNNLTATVSQTVATILLIMVLCQSESKDQCLASVGIASLLGSMIAFKYAPTHASIWYWIGPLLAGTIGYALAAAGQDTALNIGLPTGTFAALARPLPLDYASVGVAGAIIGYWMITNKEADEE